MKRWPPEYLRLATTAVNVRDRLRLVDWSKLDEQTARVLVWSIRALSAGLKAREHRPARETAK